MKKGSKTVIAQDPFGFLHAVLRSRSRSRWSRNYLFNKYLLYISQIGGMTF